MTVDSIHDLPPQLAANRRYWCGWTGAMPDTGLPIYRSDIKHPLLNGVLRLRDWPLERAIAEARRVLTGSTWSWWVGADSDEGTAEGLLAHGGEQVLDMPVMAIDVTTVDPVETPVALKIRPMTERDELRAYVRAYAGPLGFDGGDIEAVVDRERNFAYPDVVRLAGFVDGRAVGTCTISLGTEVAALYCIATDPDHRRRGIATALTREALGIARTNGHPLVTLQASSEGEPVYQAIGFETVTRYRLFAFAK
jgi:ribosomal protein S18 acetylase RimI-like enzyme